jgi:hypothetical protein
MTRRSLSVRWWAWQSPADCQPLDSIATGGGNHDSVFDGDVDIGIGLVYAGPAMARETPTGINYFASLIILAWAGSAQ